MIVVVVAIFLQLVQVCGALALFSDYFASAEILAVASHRGSGAEDKQASSSIVTVAVTIHAQCST